jgi:hypothetical protein
MIKRCSCVNKYQDKRYGTNLRVHNPCKGVQKEQHRCTVCEAIK